MAKALTILALALTFAGCGGDDRDGALRVSAAASLKSALTAYGATLSPEPSFSFAASDQLAGQIRAGARPDVFAAANAKLPDALYADHLVERPVAFARNRLVVAVPRGSSGVRGVQDLARPGLRLAVGAPGVPIGSYTRDVLGRLAPATRRAILDRVRSEEPDVSGIVGKVATGAVDAGFVYASDVTASGGRLRAVALPARLQPVVVYEAAVVRGTSRAADARRFVAGLLRGDGAAQLHQAGFLPAP